MRKLVTSLKETDDAVLEAICRFWGVETGSKDQAEVIEALQGVMLSAENLNAIWDDLGEQERGALQLLLTSGDNMMLRPTFERMNGEIRTMGRGQIEREQPLANPQGPAEALYYRGLIYVGYRTVSTGPQAVVYVPSDLAGLMPSHRTSYDNLEDAEDLPAYDAEEEAMDIVAPIDAEFLQDITPADTTLVDDMTTLLAYLQVNGADLVQDALSDDDHAALLPHLIKDDSRRLDFLFAVGVSGELIGVQEGHARPRRAETRRWLEAKRSGQIKALVDAWHDSVVYHELWHVPGLHPDPNGLNENPVAARDALLRFLRERTPAGEWWSIDEFIMVVKEVDPDFQRPGGDYESWYIRSEAGEYLKGFESWDAVEGALLEFYLLGPLHWLGLADLAEDAVRLNAYGRAFVNAETWPDPAEQGERIVVEADGTLRASRKVPRLDRFQAMRFTTWVSAASDSEPFVMQVTMEGVQRAASQGISMEHIKPFLKRMTDSGSLPAKLEKQLDTWQGGPTGDVTIGGMTVLSTYSEDTLQFIVNTPDLRKFCGRQLGPTDVIVRPGQTDALREALEARGIQVEINA